jgi:hypothetical protein
MPSGICVLSASCPVLDAEDILFSAVELRKTRAEEIDCVAIGGRGRGAS